MLRLQISLVRIQNKDTVKTLEEESAHVNVGKVSTAHLHTDAHTHTHIQYIYGVYAKVDTLIFRLWGGGSCSQR